MLILIPPLLPSALSDHQRHGDKDRVGDGPVAGFINKDAIALEKLEEERRR
ncbi:MAG: hypothetical protein WCL50_14920 [Spirochaetota bacterium]